GIAHPDNAPHARYSAAYAVDSVGCLWLFGGMGRGELNNRRNDMWKYNPYTNEWTYLNGDTTWNPSVRPNGKYGIKGQPDRANQPGVRGAGRAAAWMDHKKG